MPERGDLDCAHEPFMYDYYVHRGIRVMPHFDIRPDHPVSYATIRDHLIARSERGPVFFKDMSYYVMPHILDDAIFAERLVNTFLIRDPVASITSYHKLDPEVTLDEIGEDRFELRCQSHLGATQRVLMGILTAMADDYGTLCLIEPEADGRTVISVLDRRHATARRFDLAMPEG